MGLATDMSSRRTDRLQLPEVTLCAVTSVNVSATIRALEACLEQIAFADCKLLTDQAVQPNNPEIRVVPIERLNSSAAYSSFLLTKLVDQVESSHCLVVQWDGHVVDANRWRPEFLDYDYIGATWPQFDDGHDVGNGGFSLRSRQLMELCRDPQFQPSFVEDVAICRDNRNWLESKGMLFAPADLANQFATERSGDLAVSFGYHGVFHMPRVLGVEAFWNSYLELDERSTIVPDLTQLIRDIGDGKQSWRRRWRLLFDRYLLNSRYNRQ